MKTVYLVSAKGYFENYVKKFNEIPNVTTLFNTEGEAKDFIALKMRECMYDSTPVITKIIIKELS